MEDRLREAVARSDADYTEARWERVTRSRVAFQRDQLMALESGEEQGGIVRCLVGGAWGVAVFTDPADLPRKVHEATHLARTASGHVGDPVALALVERVEARHEGQMKRDFRGVPLDEKRRLAEGYNKLILGHSPQIASTTVRYTDAWRKVCYANSEGTYVEQGIPDVTLWIAAVARKNGDIQQAFEFVGHAAGFDMVQGREEQALKAAQRAVELLSAKPVQGGTYTVVLDPDLAGLFIHEAFGHICEADFLLKNEPMRQVMQIGTRFGVESLNVVDDGYRPGERGNAPYDDEGVERRKASLIRNGVLTGLMHSRATAHKMNAVPTGNARAVSWEHDPIVRMRNTLIEPGTATLEEMLQGIERGLYACAAFAGETAFEQFTFSAAYGHEIVNGKIGPMVRDVVLTGNVFHTLQSIEMIGRDLRPLGGSCGKFDQSPLPTTMGGPHVRVRNVTVGGR